MNKEILVTGATGNIGSLIVPQLLEKGVNVRILVRNVSKAAGMKEAGVEVFEGDFEDLQALYRATEGVDAVMAITPAGPGAVAQGEALLNAALKSGKPYYVRLSAIGAADDAPTDNGRLHYQTDQAVIRSGLPFTILRPHYFMQNLFMAAGTINTEGKMYLGMGQGSLGMIDVRDIADACVAILLSDDHKGKIYTPTGPESITFSRVSAIISNGMGKQVDYVPIPIEAVGQAILDAGWGEWGSKVMMDYSRAYSQGWGDFTTTDVEVITGNEARSFQQFFEEVLFPALRN